MNSEIDTMTTERLAHRAANEAISIVMGVRMLQTISTASLTEKQQRAIQLLEHSADQLVHFIDAMKSREMVEQASECNSI